LKALREWLQWDFCRNLAADDDDVTAANMITKERCNLLKSMIDYYNGSAKTDANSLLNSSE